MRAVAARAAGLAPPELREEARAGRGPALRIDVKVDGSLSDAGLCYAVLGALWAVLHTKAPSYACTLRIEALASSLGAAERVVATVARQSMTSTRRDALALKALRGDMELIGSDEAPVVAPVQARAARHS